MIEIFNNGTHKIETDGQIYVPPVYPKFEIENKIVTVNAITTPDFNGVYFAEKNDTVNLSMSIKEGEHINLTRPPYPPFLMLPLLKIGGVDTILDEIYFKTLIEDGFVVIDGAFPSAGNWQLTEQRVNASLAEIGVDWRVISPTIYFRVA